jgi:uncharacterized protein YndB with AHSA1/START domain
MRWTSMRTINAPSDRVFHVVADPDEFQKAIPEGGSVEYLTTRRSGVGAKFRATRLVKGKPTPFDQEVTEFVPGERVRMINVTHGTEWDSTFAVRRDGTTSMLTLTMDARTDRLLARIVMRLIGRMVQRSLDKDMDAVKVYCER